MEYYIIYEDADYYGDESYLYVTGENSLEDMKKRAMELVEEGHRNVRVMKSVVVAEEVWKA